MPTSPISEVIQRLRSTLLLLEGADVTDGQLLECFVSRREPAALEALVRRHGPMVWGVCYRTLHNHHDAEDAFQATFLVLVRKAASIYPRAKVGNWLYGVAHRTALKARATRAKRQVREWSVTEMPEPAVTEQDLWSDLQPLLDQELSRLPEKYRTVIVLCELEGKTGREAARQLGCPEGTVASRLARARTMLAKRLTRHGLAVTGGTLGAVLSQKVASAAVPASVMTSTIKAVTLVAAGNVAAAGMISVKVAALTEAMVKAMLLNKLKTAAVVLLILAMVGFGGALYTHQAGAQQGPTDKALAEGENPKPTAGERGDKAQLQAPPAKPSQFITSVGEHKFHDGKWVVRVQEEKGKLRWSVTRVYDTSGPGKSGGISPDSLISKGSPWFVFVQSPEAAWVYDGDKEMRLIEYSEKEAAGQKNVPSTAYTCATLPTGWFELLKKNPPKEMLDRLPLAVRPKAQVQK